MARILVSGCARNVEDTLELVVSNLSKLKDYGHDLTFFLVESDSKDKTLEKLRTMACNMEDFSYESVGNLRSSMPDRIDRLVFCRNRYMQFFLSNIADFDFLLVADLDEVNLEISWDGVLNELSRTASNRVFFPSNAGHYYDVYALRSECWPNSMLLSWVSMALRIVRCPKLTRYLMGTVTRQITSFELKSRTTVSSAFGGLAIYGAALFSADSKYVHTYDSMGISECEHVGLNFSLAKRADEMVIIKDWQNSGSQAHTLARRILEPVLSPGRWSC